MHLLRRLNVMLDFINFVLGSCREHGTSENYKMKNSCSQWDSNPRPAAPISRVLDLINVASDKLLSGDPALQYDDNIEIVLAVQEYIKNTERFWFSQYL